MKSKMEIAKIRSDVNMLSNLLTKINDMIENFDIDVQKYSKVSKDGVCVEKFYTDKGLIVAKTKINKNKSGNYSMSFNEDRGCVTFNNRLGSVCPIGDVEFTDVTSGLRDLYYDNHSYTEDDEVEIEEE